MQMQFGQMRLADAGIRLHCGARQGWLKETNFSDRVSYAWDFNYFFFRFFSSSTTALRWFSAS